ncbi:hypothetical protein FRC03_002633 [Tulasnella sp. 419]|nr:hypothetical protein FRC03_002633 [Tulasnella sp. 419]
MLPAEVYQIILENVVKGKDLCALARTSTLIQLEAERIIYRTISPQSTIQLCKAACSILKQRHRHQFVQTLILQPRYLFWNSVHESSLVRLLARLLRVITQLKVLKISTFPAWVFWQANHPFLYTLDIQLPLKLDENYYHKVYSSIIAEYLRRHPAITNLAINRFLAPYTQEFMAKNSQSFLPSLHTLSYTGYGSLDLIKDKQLSRLSLVHLQESPAEIDAIVSTTLGMGSTLLVLDLAKIGGQWSMEVGNQEIEKIARSLPLLRYFGLPFYEDPEPERDRTKDDGFISIVQSHLPKLVILFLGQGYHPNRPNISSKYHIVPRLLTARESLMCVITNSVGYFETMIHTRWSPSEVYNDTKHLDIKSTLSDFGIDLYKDPYMDRFLYFT